MDEPAIYDPERKKFTVKEREYDGVRPGGLMRCCTETISDLYPEGGNPLIASEGDKLQCKYAAGDPLHKMIFRDGAWEWDRQGQSGPFGRE